MKRYSGQCWLTRAVFRAGGQETVVCIEGCAVDRTGVTHQSSNITPCTGNTTTPHTTHTYQVILTSIIQQHAYYYTTHIKSQVIVMAV